MNKTLLEMAEENYIALLRHPYDLWRIQNQRALCNARDLICALTGESSQEVQERCEACS